jgi:hypothetical protein
MLARPPRCLRSIDTPRRRWLVLPETFHSSDFAPVEHLRPPRINGTRYGTFGPVLGR